MQKHLLITLVLLSGHLLSQEKFTISGYVKESSSGETLPSVTIFIKNQKVSTSTNAYGFYSFTFTATDSVQISFGAAVLNNTTADTTTQASDDYVYVYGVRGKSKELIAARAKPDQIENASTWKFWNGNDWVEQVRSAAAIEDSVSNELSVTPIGNNQYALVYQYAGIYPTIYAQFGPSPVGPFGPRRKVWDTTTDIKDPDLFTYNAKAHPAISKSGELLVSYNVNSFKFFDVIERMPDLYRPRFIRIIFDQTQSN